MILSLIGAMLISFNIQVNGLLFIVWFPLVVLYVIPLLFIGFLGLLTPRLSSYIKNTYFKSDLVSWPDTAVGWVIVIIGSFVFWYLVACIIAWIKNKIVSYKQLSF